MNLRVDGLRFFADWNVVSKRCVIDPECADIDDGGIDEGNGNGPDAPPECGFDAFTVTFAGLGPFCTFPISHNRVGFCLGDNFSSNLVGSALRNRSYRCNYLEGPFGLDQSCIYGHGGLTFCDVVAIEGLLAPRPLIFDTGNGFRAALCDYSQYTPDFCSGLGNSQARYSYVGQTAPRICTVGLPANECTVRTQVASYISVMVSSGLNSVGGDRTATVTVSSLFAIDNTLLGAGPTSDCELINILSGKSLYFVNSVQQYGLGSQDDPVSGPLGSCQNTAPVIANCPSPVLWPFVFLFDPIGNTPVTHGPINGCNCDNLSIEDPVGWTVTLQGNQNP